MKNKGFKMMVILAGIVLISVFSIPASAQGPGRGRGMGPCAGRGDCMMAIPGLTDEQRTAIEELRSAHFRKAELIRAEIGEKEARMKTLKLADKPDVKAIDGTIDDISKLRGDLMKQREAHQREVKALLNDEQKAFFNSRTGKNRNNEKGFNRQGRHGRGMGKGPGNFGGCPYAR